MYIDKLVQTRRDENTITNLLRGSDQVGAIQVFQQHQIRGCYSQEVHILLCRGYQYVPNPSRLCISLGPHK